MLLLFRSLRKKLVKFQDFSLCSIYMRPAVNVHCSNQVEALWSNELYKVYKRCYDYRRYHRYHLFDWSLCWCVIFSQFVRPSNDLIFHKFIQPVCTFHSAYNKTSNTASSSSGGISTFIMAIQLCSTTMV